jgi:hypothetical protein
MYGNITMKPLVQLTHANKKKRKHEWDKNNTKILLIAVERMGGKEDGRNLEIRLMKVTMKGS